jgi:Ca2+/Na+ antiporter
MIKALIDFYFYLHYRFMQYYDDGKTQRWGLTAQSLILIGFLLTSHCITLVFLLGSIFDFYITFRSSDPLINRFVIAPLVLLPSILFLVYLFSVNKKRFKEKIKFFEQESQEERIKRGNINVAYIIISVLLVILSAMSPMLTK